MLSKYARLEGMLPSSKNIAAIPNARLVETLSASLAKFLNPIVKIYEKDPAVTEILKFLLSSAESEKFRQLITPDVVCAWLAAEDHVNRISKVMILLELRDVSMCREKIDILKHTLKIELGGVSIRTEKIAHILKKGELVPLDVIDDQSFASACACLLTQIENHLKKIDAIKKNQRLGLCPLTGSIEFAVQQVELFANLPVRSNLYQLMRSENFFRGLRESINQYAAQTLGFLFFALNSAGKMSFIDAVSPDCGSREVLKDYWLCQIPDISEKFPRVDQKTFLSELSSRSPGENLRIALELFPRLNGKGAQEIFEDSRFSWPLVIENHGVFNWVIALMLLRKDSLHVPEDVHHFFSENYETHNSLKLIEKQISEFQQVMQEENKLQATRRLSVQNASQSQTAAHTFDEQRSENGQLLFKLDYWYDIDDMNKIIKCEIDSRGLTNQDQSVLSMSAFSFEDKGFLNYLIAGFKCIMEEQQKKQKPYTVLLPLQIHGNHWVGCVLNIDSENDSAVFRYFDPMPGRHQSSMIATLQALFTHVLGRHYKIQSAPADEYVAWLQSDSCSCGPYVIANFMRYAYSEGLKDPVPSAHAIRKKQVEMISGFREKQFKKLNSALAYQLTAEKEASDLQLQTMDSVLESEERLLKEIDKNPLEIGLKLWREMVLLAQKIDRSDPAVCHELVPQLFNRGVAFRFIPCAPLEKIFSSGEVSSTFFADDDFSSINLLMNVYFSLSVDAREKIVASIIAQQKDSLGCYRDVLRDYWRSTKEIPCALFPICDKQIFLSRLKERKPEENLRMALGLFSCLTSEEVNSLIKDPRFDWFYIIKDDAVLKITLAAMFYGEGDEKGDFAAKGVARTLWDAYIQYKKNKIPSLGLGDNTNGLFVSRLPQAAKTEENRFVKTDAFVPQGGCVFV